MSSLLGCNGHPIKSVQLNSTAVCGESIDIAVVKPEVVLVLDRSGSMSDNPLGDTTRWEALHGVISDLIESQPANTQLGLAMFPAADAGGDFSSGACNASTQLDVEIGAATGSAIMSAMPAADATTSGGTPATTAIELAADHLRVLAGDNPKFMVFVTDGEANCSADSADWQESLAYDAGLQSAVATASMDGITTYVVGIQISTALSDVSGVVPAEQLDEVASLGGAPLEGDHQFYSVEDNAALGAALSSITAEFSCGLQLGSALDPDRDLLVKVGDGYREEVIDCAAESGWTLGGADGNTLNLCGQACSDYQATGQFELEYLCD